MPLFDRSGYILFQTEEEFRKCPYLSIGKDVSVPKPGISAIPGYVRVVGSPSRHPAYPPEEVAADVSFAEGSVVRIRANRYERDARARMRCIQHYGPKCVVCGFDFGRTYGQPLSGFIHIHHLTPLASIGKAYRVNPIRDLRPICANCHAVVHRRTTVQCRGSAGHGRGASAGRLTSRSTGPLARIRSPRPVSVNAIRTPGGHKR